jgi:NAD(P)-dependent dehydrogenase (short-subunit alcohol dehydrogenase family)
MTATALITGGTSGIGRATASKLAQLARISHTTLCIGAPNQRKLLCENDFHRFAERPDADRV